MKNKIIISGFPAIGKTHLAENASKYGLTISDSDSSEFSWIEENGEKTRNPNFAKDYVAHIKSLDCDMVLVSSHKEVRDALVAEKMRFILVYPQMDLKDEYLERCKKRGSSVKFIDNLASNWKQWIIRLKLQNGCSHLVLDKNGFISDLLPIIKQNYFATYQNTPAHRKEYKKILSVQVFKRFTDTCWVNLEMFTDFVSNRFVIEDFSYAGKWTYQVLRDYFIDKVIPHKIAVYQAGMELIGHEWVDKLNINIAEFKENLCLHDISKFSAEESFGYAFHDFSKPEKPDPLFDKAWLHHKNHNPHHPEYWLNVDREGLVKPLPMPNIYLLEMVADWIGAGKTHGNTLDNWLPKNLHLFTFHTETMWTLSYILQNLGFNTELKNGKLHTT